MFDARSLGRSAIAGFGYWVSVVDIHYVFLGEFYYSLKSSGNWGVMHVGLQSSRGLADYWSVELMVCQLHIHEYILYGLN